MSNRPRTRKSAPKSAGRKLPVVPIVVAVALAAVAIAAVLITQLGSHDGGTSGRPGSSQVKKEVVQTGDVEVSGAQLPPFQSGSADPAIGMVAPTIRGVSFDDTPVSIAPGADPMLVLFAAHWCPHCQAEIPLLAGPFRTPPAGTKVVTVSTGVASNRPNYPPSAWFEREKWPTPVLADDATSRAAEAYGLTGYPFYVYIDKNGKVVERASGERPVQKVMASLQALATT